VGEGAPLRLAQDVHQVVIAPVDAHSSSPEQVATGSSVCWLVRTWRFLRGDGLPDGRFGATNFSNKRLSETKW
jgi:hypothetical protein